MRAISAHVWLDITPETLDDLLCQAASEGDAEQFRFLIEQGAQPFRERWKMEEDWEGHEHDRLQPSFLMEAVAAGRAEMVQLLLELGADVQECCPRRDTWPLLQWVMTAQDVPRRLHPARFKQIGQALLEAGADPDFILPGGRQPRRNMRPPRGSVRWRAQEYKLTHALDVLGEFDAKRRAEVLSAATVAAVARARPARL